MGQATPTETERNQAIYNDWKTGQSYSKLSNKYGITATRVGQIVRRERFLDIVPDDRLHNN